MSALFWVAACWLTPGLLIFAWIKADQFFDGRWDAEHTSLPDADPGWLDSLVDDLPMNEWVDETPMHDRIVCEQIERREWA